MDFNELLRLSLDIDSKLDYLGQIAHLFQEEVQGLAHLGMSDGGLILPRMKDQIKGINHGGTIGFEIFAIAIISKIHLAPKTRESYESVLRCHVLGKIPNASIESITYDDILLLTKNLPSQIRAKLIAVLRTIFREAKMQGLITESPLQGKRNPVPIVAKKRFLNLKELNSLDFGRYKTQIQFLGLHGLRWGEAVVLTPNDIRGDLIYINKSIHGATKSRAGNRVVPLVSDFKVFPKSPKTLRKVLSEYGVTIHSLRHTYAYILKMQGIHVTTAQRLLGHSDPKITMAIYTEVLDDEIEAAGQILRMLPKS